MKALRFGRKVVRGFPYLVKEIRAQVSNQTPFFIAKPRTVHLWRSTKCNARCIMCHFGYITGEKWKELQLLKSPLTDEIIPRLLDEIHQLGGRGTLVSYGGSGEPLLCASMMNWLEQAKKLKLDFRFTTNGYTIDADTAHRLVVAGLFNIGVSIESLDPGINEAIRPYPDGTARTTRAIDLLLEEKRRQKAPLSVNIKITLTQLNIESILDIVKRWGKTDGVLVTPQMFEAVDDMPEEIKHRLWIKDLGRLEAVVCELKRLKADGYNINADDRALDDCVQRYRNDPDHKSTMHTRSVVAEERPPCFIGTDNLYIIEGKVYPCPYLAPIGSVLEGDTTLRELWYGEKARQARAAMKKCRIICTTSCTRQTSFLDKVRIFLKM